MRDKDLIARRNALIFERYSELWGAGQREECIWPVLSEAFFLSATQIYRIVLSQTKQTHEKQQLNLFNSTENESK